MTNIILALFPAMFTLLLFLSRSVRVILAAVFKTPGNATVVVRTADGTVTSFNLKEKQVELAQEDLAKIIANLPVGDVHTSRPKQGGGVGV
ncbi:MAG TPA: hypothetical protein VNO31_06435 [Umezawaea sp.]|nr:hypothetical protein [Umezawaea sp.]